MYTEDMKRLSDKIASGKLEEAEALIKTLHAAYNDQPLAHARIHFAWANLARRRKNHMRALGQLMTGMVFAIPVSLFKQIKSS